MRATSAAPHLSSKLMFVPSPAYVAQSLLKRNDTRPRRFSVSVSIQDRDTLHPAGLLRTGRKRPCERSTNPGDKFTPLHSITSSTRACLTQ